jgi:hypothetical protein
MERYDYVLVETDGTGMRGWVLRPTEGGKYVQYADVAELERQLIGEREKVANLHDNLAGKAKVCTELAGKLVACEAALDAEREKVKGLETWRVAVTLALQRPGGARFEDVPGHVKQLVADLTQLQQLVGALPKAGGIVWIYEEPTGWIVAYGDDDCQENFAFGLDKQDADALHDLLKYRTTMPAPPSARG